MSEAEARALRGDLEVNAPVWVAGFRIVGGTAWEIEVRDLHRKGLPWFVIRSRAQAVKKWPALNT